MLNDIPTLDLSLMRGTANQRSDFLTQLRFATHEVGFFHLTGHGVDTPFLAHVRRLSHQFFALPEEEKLAVAMINSSHFRGYNRAAAELTRGAPDWREQFDIGAERSPIPLLPSTPPWERMHGPNQWPARLPNLKQTMLDFNQRMTEVALQLLHAFALSLELPENTFDDIYGCRPNEHIKLIRYPGRDTTASDQGVGAHKDSGILTFVLQDKQAGLQVEYEKGNWIDVLPQDDKFVVNIGEILELATNGYLRATVHRVVTPPPGSERYSVAYFLGASLDAVVPVFKLPPHLAIEAGGVEADPANPLLRDVGLNYLKGRFRSHPDVAQKFHSDLQGIL